MHPDQYKISIHRFDKAETQNLQSNPVNSIVVLRTCLLVKALNLNLLTAIVTQQALVLPQIILHPVGLAYLTQQVPSQIIRHPVGLA